VLLDTVCLMYPSTKQFYNKQISTVLAFVYCVEVLHVSTLHYMNMSLIIGLFTNKDSDQWFEFFFVGFML
jgi:hypothetical protein